MSALCRVSIGAVAAGLCCLPLALVAQQIGTRNSPPGGVQQTPTPSDVTTQQGQPDRPLAPQLNRPQANRTLPARQQQPYSANYRGTTGNAGAQASTVEGYLTNCLLKNNKAEIELSQFAAEQSDNPQVKQFAQELVKDHKKVVEQLQQFAGAGSLDASPRDATDSTPAPGAPGIDNTTLGATGARDATTANERGTAARQPAMQGAAALGQLAAIEEKINDRCNQALREELQSKSGTEFDQCYVGSQIAGHMHMLAALEVLSEDGQGQLKQVAEEAKPTVQKHLEHAKQLANQMHSGAQSSAQAQRPSTSRERQD